MTDQERISRESLVKRAAVAAGAIYAAPVLASSAGAAVNQRCRGKCSGNAKCNKRGGKGCNCCDGTCTTEACDVQCPCEHVGPKCGGVEPCGSGNCACFFNGVGANPGACVDLLDGLCDTFQAIGTCPGGSDAECPAGTRCFTSCCDENFGYPPLCGPCCSGAAAPAGRRPSGASVAQF